MSYVERIGVSGLRGMPLGGPAVIHGARRREQIIAAEIKELERRRERTATSTSPSRRSTLATD